MFHYKIFNISDFINSENQHGLKYNSFEHFGSADCDDVYYRIESNNVLNMLHMSMEISMTHNRMYFETHFKLNGLSAPKVLAPIINPEYGQHLKNYYARHIYQFKITPEIQTLFDKIMEHYCATEQNKDFKIVPSIEYDNKKFVNFEYMCNPDYPMQVLLFNETYTSHDMFISHKLYMFMCSEWSRYFTYNIIAYLKFNNDNKSENRTNFTPTFYVNTVHIKIDPHMVNITCMLKVYEQTTLLLKIAFLKFGRKLPPEIWNYITLFLIPHEVSEMNLFLQSKTLEYITTKKYITDIVNDVNGPIWLK